MSSKFLAKNENHHPESRRGLRLGGGSQENPQVVFKILETLSCSCDYGNLFNYKISWD
jgi:hypothetical protein